MQTKYVTAFNGARDHYELPLALEEAQMLHSHLSDFYLPDVLAGTSLARRSRIGSRYRIGLPSSKVRINSLAAILNIRASQTRLDKTRQHIYNEIERVLSLDAYEIASQSGSSLFLHQGCAYWAFEKASRSMQKLLFQYHPHAGSVFDILEQDYSYHPEVRHSFELELESKPSSSQDFARANECQLADHIVVASTFTKHSLVLQGCDPERISVAPYGADRNATAAATLGPKRKHSQCRILFVGQGIQRKGLHHLLKCWREIDKTKAELTLVLNRVDPGLRPLLDQGKITVLSGLSNLELSKLYKSSDVFAMPSLVEGFGLVYLEALQAGLFCIGTSNTGLPDLKLTESAVAIVPAGDLLALSRAITSAIDNWRIGNLNPTEISQAVAHHTWQHHRERLRQIVAHT